MTRPRSARSHSDGHDERAPKSWRGTRPVLLSPRALAIFRQYAAGKAADHYPLTNQRGRQLSASRKKRALIRDWSGDGGM